MMPTQLKVAEAMKNYQPLGDVPVFRTFVESRIRGGWMVVKVQLSGNKIWWPRHIQYVGNITFIDLAFWRLEREKNNYRTITGKLPAC